MSWLREEAGTVTTSRHGSNVGGDPGSAPPGPPAPGGIARWRKLAVGGVVLLLVAGVVWQLGRSDNDGGVALPPTGTSTTKASTTAPTSVDHSRPPELRNTGEDFDVIVRSVDNFESWVYQHDPDPKWVPFYVDPQNVDEYGFEREQQNLANLKAQGHRYDSPPTKVHKVIVRDRVSDHQVGVYVIYEGLAASIVDRAGNVVATQPATPPTGYFEDWAKGEDGRWRLLHSEVLGPPDPELFE